jgi:exosortase D (VPLPA-CTERM-specific)
MKGERYLRRSLGEMSYLAWARSGLYVVLVFGIYFSTLRRLVLADWHREDFNYCYLIPFVVLYLLWEKRRNLSETPSKVSWEGFFALGLAIVLFWIGDLGGEWFTQYLSFWFVIVGLFWIHLGWQKLKGIWFALLMMLTMFPIPSIVNNKISLYLKLISSQLGVAMLQVYGMSAYREGNIIDLGFTQLQVVDACSGLRYVIPLLILGLILAYWFRAHIWKRVFLVLSCIPIAVIVNGLRIAGTGVLYGVWGAQVAEGFFHGFSGWLIFMLAIPVLLVEMWILKKLPPKNVGRGEVEEAAEPIQPIEPTKPAKPFHQFFSPVFIVALILLGTTLVLSNGIEFREKTPAKKPFSRLPLQIGPWSGTAVFMEQKYIDELKFADYALLDFSDTRGRMINFYSAYYASQSKGASIHSPESCLPGGGWLFNEAGTADISLEHGKSITVNRALMEKAGYRDLTYYWFAQQGRILASSYQVKAHTFWNALTKHRTDGALVRLITPVYENEKLGDAEARLQGFMRLMVPVLKEYIPE